MRGLLAAGILFLAGQAEDVVHLKDGTVRKGRIASETAQDVTLETLIRGPKGETIGSGRVTIDRDRIASIERASEEDRRKSAERSKAFGERGMRRVEALARMKPEPVTVEGAAGIRTSGTQFQLDSTCEAGFAKDVTYYLEGVFEAYRRHFGVRRNEARKVQVYLLSDLAEYQRFQRKRHGGAVLNAAYYHPKENYIAAYNVIRKEEERRIRQQILVAERAMEDFKSQVASEARRIDGLAKEARQQVASTAARQRREIRADAGGAKEGRIAQVDRWERDQQAELKKREAELQKELDDYRRKADNAIEENRKVLEQNERVILGQNRRMFEMLFHEAFHAFAANYLWEGSAQREFPRWLHEGMAGYYEMSAVEGGELVHGAVHPEFLKLLKEKAVKAALVPLADLVRGGPEMFTITHLANADRSGVYYAQSWLVAHFIAGKVAPEKVQAYVGEVLAGKNPVEAFEKLAGKKLAEVEGELRVYLQGLK